MPRHLRAGQRPGMTLIELLVTLGIMVVLLAIALPTVKFTFESSRVREASRQLNAFIASAKARAASTGRVVGMWLERDANNLNSCSKVYLAEVPQPYAGAFLTSRVSVATPAVLDAQYPMYSMNLQTAVTNYNNTKGLSVTAHYVLIDPPSMGTIQQNWTDAYIGSLISDGDRFQVQLDHRGVWFQCLRIQNYYLIIDDGVNSESYDLIVRRGAQPPNANGQAQFPFQVLRNPRRIDLGILEFPRGTGIDLHASGDPHLDTSGNFDRMSFASGASWPIVIMFRPSGRIDRMYYDNSPQAIQGTVHLLVGRVDKIPDTATLSSYQAFASASPGDLAKTYNLYDGESLWVSIGHRSGTVTTVDNNTIDPFNGQANTLLPPNPALPMGRQHVFTIARLAASTHQAKGGN
jgi:prepilin-type N-terminal cleavage/methylation domain-containing protein